MVSLSRNIRKNCQINKDNFKKIYNSKDLGIFCHIQQDWIRVMLVWVIKDMKYKETFYLNDKKNFKTSERFFELMGFLYALFRMGIDTPSSQCQYRTDNVILAELIERELEQCKIKLDK